MIIIFLCFGGTAIFAQDDLESLLDNLDDEQISYTSATFKNTRILNGHSIENLNQKNLEFRISHRFGQLNTGAYELWGLDQANIHFSLDYGVNTWLNIGIGRGTYQKTFDGFFKVKLLRQSKGQRKMPVTLSYLSTISVNSLNQKELNDYFTNRMAFVHALLLARKFSDKLSLQLSPHFVHRNYVATKNDNNDLLALGMGGRYKITNRISINLEYFYVANLPDNQTSTELHHPLSIGFDIETGGHVFQLHLTNSLAMIEKAFIGETKDNWNNGGIHFGFNISRVFSL